MYSIFLGGFVVDSVPTPLPMLLPLLLLLLLPPPPLTLLLFLPSAGEEEWCSIRACIPPITTTPVCCCCCCCCLCSCCDDGRLVVDVDVEQGVEEEEEVGEGSDCHIARRAKESEKGGREAV